LNVSSHAWAVLPGYALAIRTSRNVFYIQALLECSIASAERRAGLEKTRVGILTFHDGFNYGTYLQAYSLQMTLRSLGYENELINYKPQGAWVKEYKWLLHRQRPGKWMRNVKKIAHFRMAHSRLERGKLRSSPLDISKARYDAIIIGSDEVWNFRHPLHGFDPTYFSHGLKADRIVSYAATFGSIDSKDAIPGKVQSSIDNIDFLSVRDLNSLDLVQRITDKPVSLALDPTLLHDFSAEIRTNPPTGYILVYCTGLGNAAIRAIRRLAAWSGKRLLSIGYSNPWCDMDKVAFDPLRFPGFFRHADFVVTNMFHGSMFSIKYGRPFGVLDSPYRRRKIGTFLQTLGLEGRIIPEEGSALIPLYRLPLESGILQATLKEKADESLCFLKRALPVTGASGSGPVFSR
jgi:hypothetical protein